MDILHLFLKWNVDKNVQLDFMGIKVITNVYKIVRHCLLMMKLICVCKNARIEQLQIILVIDVHFNVDMENLNKMVNV
jgi:hypothetical protein